MCIGCLTDTFRAASDSTPNDFELRSQHIISILFGAALEETEATPPFLVWTDTETTPSSLRRKTDLEPRPPLLGLIDKEVTSPSVRLIETEATPPSLRWTEKPHPL